MDKEDPESDGKANVCPICMRCFNSVAGLKQHWTKDHSDAEIKAAIANKAQPCPQQPSESSVAFYRNSLQIILNDSSSEKTYQQFSIIENGGAGDCLFLAVLAFLRNPKNNHINAPKDTSELRQRAVNYIVSSNNGGLSTPQIQ